MNMQEELNRWKDSFRAAKTPEEKAEHERLFQIFLDSLSSAESKEFARVFCMGFKETVERYERVLDPEERSKEVLDLLDGIRSQLVLELKERPEEGTNEH
ncbi:MAG: hypothetical protein LBU44_04780 [Mediterranea sp.]|jgi:hypothetical protein|nr:hypothetical protein [Mediterranea sp.]